MVEDYYSFGGMEHLWKALGEHKSSAQFGELTRTHENNLDK